MKSKLKQISMLGGLYLIISFILDLFENDALTILNGFLFIVLIVWAFILLFLQPRTFLQKLENRFPNFSTYLRWGGWVAYLELPVYIWGVVAGYRYANAAYYGHAYDTIITAPLLIGYSVISIMLLIMSALGATIEIAQKYRVKLKG